MVETSLHLESVILYWTKNVIYGGHIQQFHLQVTFLGPLITFMKLVCQQFFSLFFSWLLLFLLSIKSITKLILEKNIKTAFINRHTPNRLFLMEDVQKIPDSIVSTRIIFKQQESGSSATLCLSDVWLVKYVVDVSRVVELHN
jgi:hypothetical protein